MIRMAVCDDDPAALKLELDFLRRFRAEQGGGIEFAAFESSLELLAEIESGACFDALFLDIIMPGQDGMKTAREIRRTDGNVKIVFLTSSPEYAVQSYTVGAHFYQLKPLRWEDFRKVMGSVMESLRRDREQRLILNCKSGIVSLDPDLLEYCEVIHRTLMLHLSSGEVLESTGSLDDLMGRLEPLGSFLRPHRSYLVNLGRVRSISYRGITMSSMTEIPIPRGKYNEIKDAFLAYAFREGGGTL